MQVEIIEQFVDRQLVDAGLKSDLEEQAVRLLLFHLCIAIDIYRHMTQAEKNKAGYWYREKLKNSFSITGFLKERKKERKRKRDKKKSPLHPSYKEESGVKEKANTVYIYMLTAGTLVWVKIWNRDAMPSSASVCLTRTSTTSR